MGGWLFKNIVVSFLSDLINGALDYFGDMINSIFESVADLILSNSLVTTANTFTTNFGLLLVVLLAAKTYFTVHIMETEGDSDSNVLDILYRAAQATAVIACNQFITNMLLDFSKVFTSDLSSSAEIEITTTIASLVVTAINQATLGGGVFIILLLVIVIALIVFVAMAGLRGAELGLGKILLPIFAADLAGLKRERWNNFFVSYLITIFGYSLQMLCFRAFMGSLVQMSADRLNIHGLATLGWLVLMLRAPKWLEKFCYTTGISRSAGGAGRSIPYMFMMLKR